MHELKQVARRVRRLLGRVPAPEHDELLPAPRGLDIDLSALASLSVYATALADERDDDAWLTRPAVTRLRGND